MYLAQLGHAREVGLVFDPARRMVERQIALALLDSRRVDRRRRGRRRLRENALHAFERRVVEPQPGDLGEDRIVVNVRPRVARRAPLGARSDRVDALPSRTAAARAIGADALTADAVQQPAERVDPPTPLAGSATATPALIAHGLNTRPQFV
ncbi:MAG TPA: hypothetical protein VIK08_02270 [Candidatus Limnocylindrales bacterium]